VENAEGKRLIKWIEENGWELLNGNKQGKEEGEWAYKGSRRETVIDNGIVNDEAWEGIEEFRIGEISIEEKNHEQRGKGRAKEEQKKVTIKIWDDQGVEEYRRRLEKPDSKSKKQKKMAVELKEVIEKPTTKKEVIVKAAKERRKKNEWWDKECEQLKKETVKALREWKRTKINRNSFVEAKEREKQRRKGVRDRNKLFFWKCRLMFKKNCNHKSGRPYNKYTGL
jgi:hypothetical protein